MKSHSSCAVVTDDYAVYRHLFRAAQLGAEGWSIYGTYSDPGNTMLTEYVHEGSGDRIKAQSFDYDEKEAKYRKHIFTFTQGSDE